MNDAINSFQAAILDAGINPPNTIIGDGMLHRAHCEGDRAGSKNLAYILHLDGRPAGWFQHFAKGVSATWSASGKTEPLSADMRAADCLCPFRKAKRTG